MADSEQRTAAATPPEAQSLGAILKQARASRNLSLEQVSTELRIETRQLDALEQDRFDLIAVPVFVKGYLRQYGLLLGLDVRELLVRYQKQTSLQEIQVQPSKTIRLRDERQITTWIVAAVILAVLVVALAAWWWNGGEFRIGPAPPATQTSTEPSAATPVAASAPASAPAPAVAVAKGGSAAGRPASTPAAAPVTPEPASTEPITAEPANAAPANAEPATVVRDPGLAPLPAPAADRAAAPAAPDAQPVAPNDREPSITAALAVTFEQESWAEINDARGERLFYGLGTAGRNAQLSGEPPFAVVLGNSAGVRIKVDGEDFPVPTNGKPGEYARFSVDIAGD